MKRKRGRAKFSERDLVYFHSAIITKTLARGPFNALFRYELIKLEILDCCDVLYEGRGCTFEQAWRDLRRSALNLEGPVRCDCQARYPLKKSWRFWNAWFASHETFGSWLSTTSETT